MHKIQIHHNSLAGWHPDKTFTEADLQPLREILYLNLAETTATPDDKNMLLRQKRDALIDYWLVTTYNLQQSTTELPGAELSDVDLSYLGSSAELILPGIPVPYHFPQDGLKINLAKARLTGANLTKVKLCHSDLTDADLSHANLSKVNLRYSDLTGTVLYGIQSTTMATFYDVSLRDAILDDADLFCSIYKADMHGVSMRGGRLYGVGCQMDLFDACLHGVDLSGMIFSSSSLNYADLTGSDLTGCNLFDVTMDNLCLRGTNLTECSGHSNILKCYNVDKGKDIDTSMYRHRNVILEGAYKETRTTDPAGNVTVVKKPVTLDEFNQMNTFV
ncbi:MAG TPA: pentapeptide repeat-containing protein [Puia sp.]|nr:pentapeptide repeat-containing protein [Puia sp.]